MTGLSTIPWDMPSYGSSRLTEQPQRRRALHRLAMVEAGKALQAAR
jgi:hypothetical protein